MEPQQNQGNKNTHNHDHNHGSENHSHEHTHDHGNDHNHSHDNVSHVPVTYQRGPWLTTPVAIIIAGIVIGISLVVAFKQPAAAPVAANGKPAVNVKDVKITANDPFIGNANAKVTLVEWSDYQCPFCKAVEVGDPRIKLDPTPIATIIKEYVDTGKVKIVFKDFPFLGEDSITAALYERAIWEKYPSKFYEWRKKMFSAQDDEGDQGFGDEASILNLTATISGIDANAVKALVAQNKDKYNAEINADREEGGKFGVQGTPGFVTGKVMIDGAQQYAAFKAAIDAQL